MIASKYAEQNYLEKFTGCSIYKTTKPHNINLT